VRLPVVEIHFHNTTHLKRLGLIRFNQIVKGRSYPERNSNID
jgi:hypothetical protein